MISALIPFIVTLTSPVSDVPVASPLPLQSAIQDKNFYALSVLSTDPIAKKSLGKSQVLKRIAQTKIEALQKAYKSSTIDWTSLEFSESEVNQVGEELAQLASKEAELSRITEGKIRSSGCYYQFHNAGTSELLDKAWRVCAGGINNAIRVYGKGEHGRSWEIDGISYDPKSTLFLMMLHNVFGVVLEQSKENDSFFDPTLRLSLALMDVNRRDEAGRLEPMEKGENAAAYKAIRHTAWDRYTYSLILVPGFGPEEPDVQLSPIGKLGLQLAADRYKKGLAPFIMVSGGYVHPKQTKFCEALEMKRSLIKDFGIPEKAILIDPHARHTTTNLRNAARIIYRYGIPFNKPGLITTNTYQSSDIESAAFRNRCQRVFNFQPIKVQKRISDFDITFLPNIESLTIDPIDPLDP